MAASVASLDALITALTALPAAARLADTAAAFCRIGAFLAFFPGYASGYIPIQVRLFAAVTLSIALQPTVTPFSLGTLTASVAITEVLTGLMFATFARMFEFAAATAGGLAAQAMGLVNVFDTRAESEGASVMAGLMSTAMLAAFFTLDGPIYMLKALINTYHLVPFAVLPNIGDANAQLLALVIECFRVGVQAAGPFLLVAWVFNLGLGFVNRIMPQMPVFFVGQSASLLLGLSVMIVSCGAMIRLFLQHFYDFLRVT